MRKYRLCLVAILIMFLAPTFAFAANSDKLAAAKAIPSEGNTFVIPLEVANTQELIALDIPLEYSSGVVLEKVEFTDLVERFEFKHAKIDAVNNRVVIGMLSMVTENRPDLVVGSGVIANLHFTVSEGTETIELKAVELEKPNHSLTYYYNDYSDGSPQVKEIKPELSISSLALTPGNGAIPNDYGLSQNWPNPFNPTTTISFALPEAGELQLSVFNILGQQVMDLASGYYEAGNHEFTWDGTDTYGSNVASGVYFYRAKVNNFTETKKMVLTK